MPVAKIGKLKLRVTFGWQNYTKIHQPQRRNETVATRNQTTTESVESHDEQTRKNAVATEQQPLVAHTCFGPPFSNDCPMTEGWWRSGMGVCVFTPLCSAMLPVGRLAMLRIEK